MRKLRFIVVALILSAAWYPILVLLPLQGGFIRSQLHPEGANLYPIEFILLFCLAGLTVAWVLRRRIIFAELKESLMLGCTLPYVSATLFLILLTARAEAWRTLETGRFTELLGVLGLGLFDTVRWLPLIAPIGIGIQFALRWAGRASGKDGESGDAGPA